MRHSTALFFFIALIGGFALFKVKYKVVEIETKLSQTLQQIERERENIHILKAEWSHLNEPQRLKNLAQKYLDIVPMKTEQIAAVMRNGTETKSFKDIPANSHLASMKGLE